MTKVTDFNPNGIPIALDGWSTGYQSIGSNTDSNPPLSALNFVQRITANTSNTLLNPIVNFASGSNILLTLDAGPANSIPSNTIRIHSTGGGSGGTISAGSNSTWVQEISTAGASSTLWSPFDHAHAGVQAITSSSSNTLQKGVVNLRPGSGIAIGLTDTDGDGEFDTATFSTTSGGGGGGGSGVTVTSATATSDTTVGGSSFTDVTGGSLSCVAGTYVFYGMADIVNTSATVGVVLRITDGTNHYASGEQDQPSAGFQNHVSVFSAAVVLGSTTTIKLQAFITGVGGTVKAASGGGSGNVATRLTAMKVA